MPPAQPLSRSRHCFPQLRLELGRAHLFGLLDLARPTRIATRTLFSAKIVSGQLRIGEADGVDQRRFVGGLHVDLRQIGRFHHRILQMRHQGCRRPPRSSPCARCRRRSSGRRTGTQPATCWRRPRPMPMFRHRRSGPASDRRGFLPRRPAPGSGSAPASRYDPAGCPSRGSWCRTAARSGDGRLVFPGQTQLDAAQFAVAEQELQAVALFAAAHAACAATSG